MADTKNKNGETGVAALEKDATEASSERAGYRGRVPERRRPALLLAEFDSAHGCLRAVEKLRDAGYTAFDAHTPFPVHGMDKAMGLPDSKLGWIVLCFGCSGTFLAWLMMYWMNGVDYPIVIGGKPPGTLPSMIPIMFEV